MATYYWVGGTGTWSGTGNTQFALTSGGAATLLNPTNADAVNFDANSGTAAVVTVTATAVSQNTTINKSDINLTLSGSPTLCVSAATLTLTAGTITLNTHTLTTGFFLSANSNARTIAFGTGNITVTGNAGNIWNTSAATNLTFTGTPVVNATYSGAVGTRGLFAGTGSGYSIANTPSFNVTAGTDIVNVGNANNLNFTGFSGTSANNTRNISGNLICSTGMTWSAGTSVTTFNATSGIQQLTTAGKTFDFPVIQNNPGATLQLQDNLTMGSTRTFTLTAGDLHVNNRTLSTGLFNSNTTNTRTIDFKSGNITVTGNNAVVWNTTTATNLSVLGTPVVNCTYAGSTGTRVLAVNRTTLNGIESKAINFYINAGTDSIITGAANDSFKTLSFTGFSGSFTFNATTVYQDLILSSGMTLNSSATGVNFSGNTTQLVTTAGKTLDFPITFGSASSTPTVIFQDALTQGSTRAFTITNGTVQLKASATSTTGAFATSGTNQKYLQSTTPGTQATLTQASGTVNASYLTIQDINATGGATWLAYTDQSNTDAGNVDGWNFGISPVVGGAEYTYTLRSFTQPRRF
jgi:hypothetical protein